MIILNSFFLFINFAVLVVFLSIAFKNLVLGNIYKGIKNEKEELKKIKRDKSEVESNFSMLNVAIKRQQTLCGEISDKVSKWKKNFEISDEKLEKEIQSLREVIAKKYELQQELYKNYRMRMAIIPGAIKKAKVDLEKHFLRGEEGNNYINGIIERISEGLT